MNTARRRHTLEGRDLAEIVIGSLVLAFPVAVTEEVWNMSAEISVTRALLIAVRVLTVYFVTLLVSAATLYVIDKLPLLDGTLVALKRTIIVAFPASFAATAVDSLGD